MANPLHPSATVLITLGSLAVHIDEYLSPGGHPVDLQVIQAMLKDRELVAWLAEMDKLAFLPQKRNNPPGTQQKKPKER